MKPFIPAKLPLSELNWSLFIPSLSIVNREIARYDGLLQSLPNPGLLLSPLITQEAVLSSKIEGTQATLEDVLKFEAQPEKQIRHADDIHEIINYRKALNTAVDELKKRPISLNLLKKTHQILLSGVRGKNKMTGQFRKVQNWIGKPGSPIENARYIPPSPETIGELLDNLEKYIHYDEKDRLVQLAIIHAQFEIIHPFLDGNGRIGRILIPLFLYEKKILNNPMFYLSSYFENHREEYYNKLLSITEANKWEEWILFFLKAIQYQSQQNSEKAKKILNLYSEMKEKVAEITHSQFIMQVIDSLFKSPIFSSSFFRQKSRIPRASAIRILNQLKNNNIISILEEPKGKKPAVYIFDKLIEIVEE